MDAKNRKGTAASVSRQSRLIYNRLCLLRPFWEIPFFDSYDNYALLKNEFHFERACIPMNARNSKSSNAQFSARGTPVCPLDGTEFKFLGKSGGKNRSLRFKWVCPKSVQCGSNRVCCCETPCTASTYGKCVYTYPDKDFRLYPGIPRDTPHWDNLYRHRVVVERTINLMKDTFVLDSRKSFRSFCLWKILKSRDD